MKALITPTTQYGPFASIEVFADRYRCDGAEYQFSVIGPATMGEYTAPPAPPAPSAPVPESVSPRQIRQALTRAGLRVQVEAAVAAADQDTKDWWEFATEFRRDNEHVVAMGAALGVPAAQLDALWTLAAAL